MFPANPDGSALPYDYDPCCPQCQQERRYRVFRHRTTTSLNPLAKGFIPQQGTARTPDHGESSQNDAPFINDIDHYPPLPSLPVAETVVKTRCNPSCQTTHQTDGILIKDASKSNEDIKEANLQTLIKSTKPENKISNVAPTYSKKASANTTAPTTKTASCSAAIPAKPTPASTEKTTDQSAHAPGNQMPDQAIATTSSGNEGSLPEKTLAKKAPPQETPPKAAETDTFPKTARQTESTGEAQKKTTKSPDTERPHPETFPPENNTEQRVTLASIVAKAVATNALKNTSQSTIPRRKEAKLATKIQESRFLRRPEVAEAFKNLKLNPARAETQFYDLLKAGDCHQWQINNLKEGLARSLLRQGRQCCAEAERILRELQYEFTDDTPTTQIISVHLTLAHVLINSGKLAQSQTLLLQTMKLVDPGRTNNERIALVTPCGHQNLDQAMVLLHLERCHYQKARVLLLAMTADLRPPEQLSLPEEKLILQPCGDDQLDVLMCRILEKQQRFADAEKMLLALMRKFPAKKQRRLPSYPVSPLPCADRMLNLNLLRLMSEADRDHEARLFMLQIMALAEPSRHRLSEDMALRTPSYDYKLNLGLVRQLHKECNRTVAIELLTAIMQSTNQCNSDKNKSSSDITPCHNNALNHIMLRLLNDEQRLTEAEAFLLLEMNSHRPKNQRYLPRDEAITTPCGTTSQDLSMVQQLISQKNLPGAELLMSRIVSQQRPEHQNVLSPSVALVTPTGELRLDLQMAKILRLRHKYAIAESLLLALMSTYRAHCQPDLPRKEAIVTACDNNEVNIAMVLTQEEQGNFDTAISLMLSTMAKHRPGRQWDKLTSPEQAMQTPCLHHHNNIAMLKLLNKAGKKEAALQLLLQIMAQNRPDDAAVLPPEESLSTPCGRCDVDQAAVITLLEMNKQEKSINLLLAMMKPHRPRTQQNLPRSVALVTPCAQKLLNQMLFTVLKRHTQTHGAAEQLMLAMMKSCLLPRITVCVDEIGVAPSTSYIMNMSMISLHATRGNISAAKKLLLATMNLYRKNGQRGLPEHLAQITPCHHHDLDLAMVRILITEHCYQEAKTLLLAMMGIALNAPAAAHTPCGSPVLDMAMLRLLAIAGPEEQHTKLLRACLQRYCEDSDFLAHQLINLCRQCKWAEFDQQVTRLRPTSQRDLVISIRHFNEALHCYLSKDLTRGKLLCSKAYQIADQSLQKKPQNSSLLSQKAHCARILRQPPKNYLPWFEEASALNPDREQTERDDHWRTYENQVIKLLGIQC